MPTRKQRRRRQKDRRHEYEYVYVDDEGHEVEVDEPEPARPARAAAPARTTKPGTPAAKGKPAAKSKTTSVKRIPQAPSWSRSAKRSLPWGGVMVLLMLVLLRSQPLAGRIFFALVYALLFIPFTYWVEKMTWQRHLKQTGQLPPRGKKPKKS